MKQEPFSKTRVTELGNSFRVLARYVISKLPIQSPERTYLNALRDLFEELVSSHVELNDRHWKVTGELEELRIAERKDE